MIYEPYEIVDPFDAVNCIEDILVIAGLMHDYPEQFHNPERYKATLKLYADLFI